MAQRILGSEATLDSAVVAVREALAQAGVATAGDGEPLVPVTEPRSSLTVTPWESVMLAYSLRTGATSTPVRAIDEALLAVMPDELRPTAGTSADAADAGMDISGPASVGATLITGLTFFGISSLLRYWVTTAGKYAEEDEVSAVSPLLVRELALLRGDPDLLVPKNDLHVWDEWSVGAFELLLLTAELDRALPPAEVGHQ
jgi:hypothetical protein